MGPFEAVIDFKNKKKKVAGPENITFFFAEGVRVPSLGYRNLCFFHALNKTKTEANKIKQNKQNAK